MNRAKLLAATASLLLVACGGASRIAKPDITPTHPMAVPAEVFLDGGLHASVHTVILRNGAGAWAENAYWDEYLLAFEGADGHQLLSAELVGAMDEVQPAERRLGKLRKGTRATLKRYKQAGYDIDVGSPGYLANAATITGGAMVVNGLYVAGAATTTMVEGMAAATVGGAAILGGGALLVVGGVRMIKNKRMQNEIERRMPDLPLALGARGEVHLFFPVTPSPKLLRLTLRRDSVDRVVDIPLEQALASLHMRPRAGESVEDVEPVKAIEGVEAVEAVEVGRR